MKRREQVKENIRKIGLRQRFSNLFFCDQINWSEHTLKQHEAVMYSGEYSKLGARGKDFQNWMFSKKKIWL